MDQRARDRSVAELNCECFGEMIEGLHPRERQTELLIRRLPARLQSPARWLRQPSSRWVRIPAGGLLVVGGLLSILPVLGAWMLPFGLILLAEDVRPLRRVTDRALSWIERRHPRWMGLADPQDIDKTLAEPGAGEPAARERSGS